MTRLAELPYWTAADAAELDALTYELVDAVFDHRERGCTVCAAGVEPCPRVRAAIEVVACWRRRRILLSRAKHLRLRQELDHVLAELRELEEARCAA